MCNDFRNTIPTRAINEAFAQLKIPLVFPTGLPNLEPREEIRITESAPVVRRRLDGEAELVSLRWSWPGPTGKPVYNFRSEGRRFASGRCLIPADGFYEFTDPEPGSPKRTRKIKWLFTMVGEPWFCIAGLWRTNPLGDAWTMLTTDPGPDVAPFHDRQVVALGPNDWASWLDTTEPEAGLLRGAAAGALKVQRVPDALRPLVGAGVFASAAVCLCLAADTSPRITDLASQGGLHRCPPRLAFERAPDPGQTASPFG